jgi:nucleoside-diphosphate-sugar epimerase
MRVLVIGGTLFIGRSLVRALLKEGHEVSILHRRPGHIFGKKVEDLVGDRNIPASLKAAIGERKFDVVFDNVYDWERGTTAEHVSATARALSDGLTRYVFMSSVAAYGDGLNHQEGDALATDDHPEAYVRNKAMSERVLFRLHQRHGLPAVTLRPPFIYGPENPFYREQFFWDRLRLNRPIIIPGDGRRLMQFVYVQDLVTACLAAMTVPAAIGHAFNIASPRPVTQTELVEALGAIARKKPELVYIPRPRILKAGGHPMRNPLYFGVYFDMPPITQVVSKAQRVLKFKATPFADGLKETYKWYLKNFKSPKLDFALEDGLIATSTVPGSRQAHS